MGHFDDRADPVVDLRILAELDFALAVFAVLLGNLNQAVRQVADSSSVIG